MKRGQFESSTDRYAAAARAYFQYNKILQYRMKKITDMSDDEVIQKCHWWQEENNMVQDYWCFVKRYFPELA